MRFVEDTELTGRQLGYLRRVVRTVNRRNLHTITGKYNCTSCDSQTWTYYNMECNRNECHGRFRRSVDKGGHDPYIRGWCNREGCHAVGRFNEQHNCRASTGVPSLNLLTPQPGYDHLARGNHRSTLVVRKTNAATGEMVRDAIIGAEQVAEDMLSVMQLKWDQYRRRRWSHPIEWGSFIRDPEYTWLLRYGNNGKLPWPDQLAAVDSIKKKLVGKGKGRMPPTVIGEGFHVGQIELAGFIYTALPYPGGEEIEEDNESSDSGE